MVNEKNHSFYFDQQTIKQQIVLEKAGLFGEDEIWEFNRLWDYKKDFYSLPTLVVQPQYWDESFLEFATTKKIKCLVLTDRTIGAFYKPNSDAFKTLKELYFLEHLPLLECLKIDALSPFLSDAKTIDIRDFSPIENLTSLKYLKVHEADEAIFVDIDFKKLPLLQEASLRYPKHNKSIYQCPNIEKIDTRYYEKDLNSM
jgi:hypothetical protein